MTTALATKAPKTAAPAKGTALPAKPVTLDGAQLAAAAAELKARYVLADKGETAARTHFEAADIAWQNARVVKVRVAYAAAMLTPNKGEANLLAATRYLLTDPADTPAKRTAAAKSRKNTLRNYVAAGEELQAKGLATRITEPDEEERKIVAAVFRELNKRDKDEAKGKGSGEGEGEGESEADTETDAVPMGVVDIVGHISRMQAALKLIRQAGVVISEREAGSVADMLNGFQMELSAYAEGK